jgi:hypothetical protein
MVEMNVRTPSIEALVANYYSHGAEILATIPLDDGQVVLVRREALSTLSAMYVKRSLLGWKTIGVSSAHFITNDGLAGYSVISSKAPDNKSGSGSVLLYGMAKAPVVKMCYSSRDIEYRLRVQPEGYFYLILPDGIQDPVEMAAILASGDMLQRPFVIDI